MAARTLLQQAVPTTFGLQGGRLARRARRRAGTARRRRGGAARAARRGRRARSPPSAGTARRWCACSRPSSACAEPRAALAHAPHAAAPSSPARSAPSRRAAKIAGDVVLLAQTEVGEVAEAEAAGPRRRCRTSATPSPPCSRAPARGTRRRTRRCSRARRARARARGRCLARGVAGAVDGARGHRRRGGARCGARSTGSRSTASGCARTSSARPLAEAKRLGIDAERPEDYLGSAGAFVDRALDAPRTREHGRPLRLARLRLADLGGAAARARRAGRWCASTTRVTAARRVVDGARRRRARRPRCSTTVERPVLLRRPLARRRVGMRLALDAPERLDRLVLACTVSRFGEPEQWLERAATVRAEGLEAIVDAVLDRWFTPAFDGVRRVPRDDPLDRARGLRALLRGARRAGTSATTLA